MNNIKNLKNLVTIGAALISGVMAFYDEYNGQKQEAKMEQLENRIADLEKIRRES